MPRRAPDVGRDVSPDVRPDAGPRAAPDLSLDVAVVREELVVEGAADAPPGGRSLTERELAVLALERRRYRHQGAKEQAARDELGLSATRYYQVLNALLDDEAALAHDPVLVARLRRIRAQRTATAPS